MLEAGTSQAVMHRSLVPSSRRPKKIVMHERALILIYEKRKTRLRLRREAKTQHQIYPASNITCYNSVRSMHTEQFC